MPLSACGPPGSSELTSSARNLGNEFCLSFLISDTDRLPFDTNHFQGNAGRYIRSSDRSSVIGLIAPETIVTRKAAMIVPGFVIMENTEQLGPRRTEVLLASSALKEHWCSIDESATGNRYFIRYRFGKSFVMSPSHRLISCSVAPLAFFLLAACRCMTVAPATVFQYS